jgi:hypothetical protein
LPLLYNLVKQKHADLDNSIVKAVDGIVWLLLLIIAVITYYTCYYTISSIFWPEPLSLFNWLLVVPCGIITFCNGKGLGELLSNKK